MKRTLLYACAMLTFAAALFSCEEKGTDIEDIAVTGITVAPQSYTLSIGEEVTLTATITPENATDRDVTWETSDNAIATVADGVVTAVSAGEAKITATSANGLEATCDITVNDEGEEVIHPEKVELNETAIELEVGGEPFTLIHTVLPEEAANKDVTWESDDTGIARVENGVVTAVAEGKTNITVTTVDGGKTAVCSVDVKLGVVPVTGVSWALNQAQIAINEPFDINIWVIIAPENATNKNYTITSGDESILSVEDGIMNGLKAGEVTVTVTTEDGGHEAELTVEVFDLSVHVESVSLDRETITLMFPDGNAKTLNATVLPVDATDMSLTWESDNQSVVTVADGVLTPVGEGTAKITVKSVDGDITDECTVTVNWLGEVSFLTENTWKPIGTGNGRTISDVVMVERARGKTTFNSGMGVPGSVDVRENAGYGDLLSWATVEKYQEQLCPDEWMVPTNNDFFALDRDLGGSGSGGAGMASKYEQQMGVTYGGMTYPTGPMSGQNQMAFYWTITKSGSANITVLEINRTTTTVMQKPYQPVFGFPLRCVKL